MARADMRTLLSLDRWAQILGIDPFSFNQFETPVPNAHQCEDVWYQHIWQHDYLSRSEVATAIAEAEAAFAEVAGFWPAPQYIVDEALRYPKHHDSRIFSTGRTARGYMKPVQLQWPYVVSGGVLNRTVMTDSPATPVFSDPDGDGVEDRFTITITNAYAGGTVTDPKEIAVYFTSTDRNGETLSETWRIRPVNVVISGGTVTITGHKTLLVKPDLTLGTNTQALDPAVGTNFVTEVEVYRTFVDVTATDGIPYQGVAVWDVPPDCASNCQEQVKALCLGHYDLENGIVTASFGTPTEWPYGWQPDRLRVNYVAGYPANAQGYMDDHMARIITYLSVALLPHEKCGCERSQRILNYWRSKPNEDTKNDRGRSFTLEEINTNPFVERNGALWAWKRVRQLAHGGGVAI